MSLSSMSVFGRGCRVRPLIAAVADRALGGAPSDIGQLRGLGLLRVKQLQVSALGDG